MSRTTIIDKDLGWRDIQKRLHDAQKYITAVGFPDDPSVDVTVANYAAVNELGSKKRKIPSRPFMRQAFDNNTDRLQKRMDKEYLESVIEGRSGVKTALGRIGEFMTGLIQATIRRGNFVENSPATRARKDSSRPLIDTGYMRRAVTHVERLAR